MQTGLDGWRIIRYVILYNIICCTGIAMYYLDCVIPNVSYTLKGILIRLFTFLATIVLIVGAIRTFPKDKYSNLKVWFYYAIMGGFLSAIYSFIKLINALQL